MFDPSSPFIAKPDPLQSAQKTSFAEDRLRVAVQSCELAPGSVSTEAQISERFGLGRAAVRVALARLSALGLVHPIPRAGWKVLPVTGALIGEVIVARQRVEPCLADARPDAATMARMSELAEMIDVLEGQSDHAALATRRGYERELLELLMDTLSNRLMARFLCGLWDHSERILQFLETPGSGIFAACQARALTEAAAAGDGARIVALRMADIAAFEKFAVAGLMRDRTELGVANDAANASLNNGHSRPDAGATSGTQSKRDPGIKSDKGVTS
ncbi:DNA-binding transcriptional regulator, GntR family [Poseidonocella pacifica]|uniref:DNA-binding transcriptional regulator, GntR family n=1 Tax=Poseidonocella pacifica TaxID=871651 RepID=A0A1I0YDL6_9RHOB|nr:GntR family transcriptional regulator [Poseidonocella pacifica]SFB10876.1 DNA-binding transcriptional regulator, GntR family [Poseidonocella pacifica]